MYYAHYTYRTNHTIVLNYIVCNYCSNLIQLCLFSSYNSIIHTILFLDQLLVLQKQSLAGDKTTIPRVQSIDEVDKLAGALRRIDAGKTVLENPNDCLSCVRTTNRCFHATHAYTGVPCAAYSEYSSPATCMRVF